jgi:protoporphyrinogen/coproporphyrinogen III oxidase
MQPPAERDQKAMNTLRSAVIVGAGISGLACAWRLHKHGIRVTLLEGSSRVGGVVGSLSQNGFLFEKGPQSFLGTPAILDLVRELGIESEVVSADPRAARYILRGGRLHRVPLSPQSFFTSSFFSGGTRLRAAAELFRRSRPPQHEESVADFIRRKFGAETLDNLVAPFVSGVYAGDPEQLSVRSAFPTLSEWELQYGSVLRGAMKSRPAGQKRPSPSSFRRGMETLLEAFAAQLGDAIQTEASVESLSLQSGAARAGDSTAAFNVRVKSAAGIADIAADAVIVATPAYIAGQILASLSEKLHQYLSAMPYAAVAVVAAGYQRRQIGNALDGFGYLVPRAEGLHVLGTVWNSSLFPGRAPEGMVTLTSFAGGATGPEIVHQDADAIAPIVENEVAQILNIAGPPQERAVWRLAKGIPQYNLGHAASLGAVREQLSRFPGIFLAGNYLQGPSLQNTIEQGMQTAESVRDFLGAAPRK